MATLIPELHRLYVELTGHKITLHSGREGMWAAWLHFRREEPFTSEDLRVTINHLWRGIKDGSRQPGSLRFSNLIEQPDYFEENLALARAPVRRPPQPNPARQAALEATGRTGGPQDNSGRPGGVLTSPVFVPASEAAQAALRLLKESLKGGSK